MIKFLKKLLWDEQLSMITGYGFAASTIVGLFLLFSIVSTPMIFISYKTAVYESQLYNERFGTHYSVSQFFWAGDTIKSYLNTGEQKTFNVNGLK